MTTMSEFQLTTEIVRLSKADTWDEAKLEWDLVDVEKVDEPETCMCGHQPIVEVCVIANRLNKQVTRVGNCCVKKFIARSDKIFQAVKRIKLDVSRSVNSETIEFGYDKEYITERDKKFYMDIMRKRNLSVKQRAWKESINKKILKRMKI